MSLETTAVMSICIQVKANLFFPRTNLYYIFMIITAISVLLLFYNCVGFYAYFFVLNTRVCFCFKCKCSYIAQKVNIVPRSHLFCRVPSSYCFRMFKQQNVYLIKRKFLEKITKILLMRGVAVHAIMGHPHMQSTSNHKF